MSAGMSGDDVEVIFEAVKDAATKTAWAKGVALARTAELRFARRDGSDWHYHVVTPSNGVAVPCMINPEEEDWQCRSGESDDPSRFIVALVIGLQQAGGTVEAPELRTLRVGYFFAPSDDPRPALKVVRAFFDPDQSAEPHRPVRQELKLTGSLKAGATKPPAGCSAHIEAGDLDLDPWLCHLVEGDLPIPSTSMTSVFALLTAHNLPAFWQGAPVTIHKSPYPEVIAITDRNDGVLVRIAEEGTALHFTNGAMLGGGLNKGSAKGSKKGSSASLWLPPPSTTAELPAEARWLREGRYFKAAELAYLVSEVLPALNPRFTWQDNGRNLPLLVTERPRPAFYCEAEGDRLSVTPKIVYGDPAIARVEQKTLVLVNPFGNERRDEDTPRAEVPKRERNREYALTDLMNRKLSMVPGDTLTFEGPKAMATAEAIARFARQYSGLSYSRHPQTGRWRQDRLAGPLAPEGTAVTAGGLSQFTSHGSVTPHITLGSEDFSLAFTIQREGAAAGQGGDGQRQVGAGEVFEAFRSGQSMIPLKGGGFAQLPTDWLNQYGPVLMQLWQAKHQGGEDQPLPRSLWPRYEELATNLDPSFKASAEVRALAEELTGPVPTAALPAGVQATLRPYQAEGYHWLKQRQRLELGAILADDMGLGKTLQTICIMPTGAPTLVVCPTSVMFNWQKEMAKFRPALKSRLYHGSQRSLAGVGDQDQVVLTSYGTLRRDAEDLAAIPWGLVVLDEAQTIKNPSSQVSQAAFTLKGDFKVALTGTPIENSLMDVWSQFQFLLPGFLGDHKPFAASLGSAGEAQQVAALRQQIAPYILRRTKAEVLTDLPDKIESLLHYELSPDERSRYDALYAAGQPKVQELLMGGGKLEVLEIILRLRQACCHPALGPLPSGESRDGEDGSTAAQNASPRGKLRPLLAKLDQLKSSAGGKKPVKSLVFSQWTQFLAIIEEQLGSHGYSTCRLDGSTTDRESVVAKFQDDPDVEVMLISLKAGSTGLNLTAAENVFIMDPWWNPAAENQAADRAYRIGQKKTVQVFRLVAVDTIEENIVLLKDAKQRLADAAISGAPAGQADSKGQLAHADLASLFNRST